MNRIALVALIMLLSASSAFAQIERWVDVNHPKAADAEGYGKSKNFPFESIQYALDSIDTNDPNYEQGVNIWVADGIYEGERNRNIDFNGKVLTLQSIDGPLNCIIDPNHEDRGFYFHSAEGDGSVVRGFTIQNGATLADGGGMYFDGVSPRIINCIITNNYAYWWGGGIACDNSSNPEFINCLITNNQSDDLGGGIYCGNSSPTIELCTIYGNTAFDGGGVYCDSSSPEISNCILWNNTPRDLVECEASYSCVQDGDLGNGGISNDPLFVTGPFGPYYLDQWRSPCKDHTPVADRDSIRDYDEFMLGDVTTSPCNEIDRGNVDMGFHYPLYDGAVFSYQLTINVFGNGYLHVDPNECGDTEYFVYDTDIHTHDSCCEIELNAIPDPNYRVWKWEGTSDDINWNVHNAVTLTGDTVVNVYFEPNEPHEYFVPADYPGSTHPIQDAIDDARDGDIVTIAPGVYHEQSITIMNKAIRVRSIAPSDPAIVASTVIMQPTGEELNHTMALILALVGPETVIEGLTFSGYRYAVMPYYQEDMDPGEDGFDGAAATGGGMYLLWNASPTIRYCVIEDCHITGAEGNDGADGAEERPKGGDGGDPGGAYGGGVYIDNFSNPTFENCTIKNCTVKGGDGGNGANGNGSEPFGQGGEGGGWDMSENRYAQGAGVYIGPYCSAVFKSCTFSGNRTLGGVTGISGLNEPSQTRNEPASNYTMDNFGGAIYCAGDSVSTFTNCTFSDNIAEPCTVEDNVKLDVAYGGAVSIEDGASVAFKDCSFTGNLATSGGAVFCIDSTPTFTNCNMTENSAFQGGALFAVHSMANLLGCHIEDNQATGAGEDANTATGGLGGGILYQATPALIADCTITDNYASFSGGGLYLTGTETETTSVELNNCLITSNSAGENGGGVSCGWDAEVLIRNCTIQGNEAAGSDPNQYSYGGGLACAYRADTVITDSIIWGNTCTDPNGLGKQFSLGSGFTDPCGFKIGASLGVYYSNVKDGLAGGKIDWQYCGPTLIWDSSNLPGTSLDDPLFVGGYYLSQTAAGQGTNSPCVNRGSSSNAAKLPLGRFRYTTRTDNHRDTGTIDLGYHYRKPGEFSLGDITLDTEVDWADFVAFGWYWDHNDCDWPGYCEGTDISKNTIVSFEDLVYFVDLWLAGDTVPPTPNPMEWANAPFSTGDTSVTMRAAVSVDNSGEPVQYLFDCDVCPEEGDCEDHDSDWQISRIHNDTVIMGELYAYRVKAKDTSGQETGWSPLAYVIAGVDSTAPLPNPSTWAMVPYATTATSVAMTATVATDPAGVEYYFDCTVGGGHDSDWQDSPIYEDIGLVLGQTYTYVVKTRDKSPNQNVGTPSVPGSATTEENPPGGDHEPPLPNPTRWQMVPYRYECGPGPLDFCDQMSVNPATDDNGVEYIFICEEDGGLSSGWQIQPFHNVSFEGRFVQHTWQAKARDMSPHQNEGGWSVRIRINQPGGGFVVDD